MQKDEERIPQTEPMPLSVAQEFTDWVWELPDPDPDARGKVPPDPPLRASRGDTIIYPTGTISAPGYDDRAIDFGWDDGGGG